MVLPPDRADTPGKPKRDPARHSKKDPAHPTRAKAHRPDLPPIAPALAQLLNPGIEKGTAGVGSQTGLTPPKKTGDTPPAGSGLSSGAGASTAPLPPPNLQTPAGLQPPPDNSFDRRADFANAHRARRSTQAGFREAPQAGYVAKAPTELDPELAQALGYNESDPSKPSCPTSATRFPTSPSRGARSVTAHCCSR